MIQEVAQPQHWVTGRWGGLTVLVFAAQLGLIFWLGKAHPIPRQPTDFPPSLSLAGPGTADVLALSDPTLFALPHRENFSVPAWLNIAEKQPPCCRNRLRGLP